MYDKFWGVYLISGKNLGPSDKLLLGTVNSVKKKPPLERTRTTISHQTPGKVVDFEPPELQHDTPKKLGPTPWKNASRFVSFIKGGISR